MKRNDKMKFFIAGIFLIGIGFGSLMDDTATSIKTENLDLNMVDKFSMDDCEAAGAIGCTNSRGYIEIKNNLEPKEFWRICNHEILHNIIAIENETEEHWYIANLETRVRIAQCDNLTLERYGVTFK